MTGFLCLVAGTGGGLAHLGWDLPLLPINLLLLHDPLMVAGFFGTPDPERAAAYSAHWAYGGPLFGALGGIALIIGAPVKVGALLWLSLSFY